MGDWWDFKRRQRRRLQAWRQWVDKRLQAWRRWWRREMLTKVNTREVKMDADTATQEAMGKMVMAQMQQHTLQTIREAVRQELLEDVKVEAFQAALTELDERLQHQREQLRDTFAKQKQALASELEDELERREEVLRRQTRDNARQSFLYVSAELTRLTLSVLA
jgi:hypothetical protein